MYLSMLHTHVHAAGPYPCCMPVSMLHVLRKCRYCMSISISMSCCMFKSMQHGHGPTAGTWTLNGSMDIGMQHGHGHAALTSTCCLSMSILHIPVQATCTVHVHVHAACPCSFGMPMPMLHVHV
jgi:hypothetical protein